MRASSFGRLNGLVASGVLLAVVVGAQVPKGLEGTWKLNSAKSKFSPGPVPKSMSVTYTPMKDAIRIAVHVVPPEGAEQHWEMTPSYDGKDYPVKGHPNADTISLQPSKGDKSQSTFKKGGKVTAMNVRTLSADGKTLTIEVKGTDEKGRPMQNTMVFER